MAASAGERWVGYGDIGPATRWDEALAGVDVIVHLAGLAHLPDAMSSAAADTFARVNAEGTGRLASAAVGAGVRRLVLVSSALVHGEASPGRPFTEDDEPAPASAYARSKLDAERRLMAAARGSPLQWVVLRPPMVYGAGAKGNFRRLVQLVRTRAPLPLGAATAPRTFIGIDNLADAVVRSVEHPRAANQVFLLGDAAGDVHGRSHSPHRRRAGPPRVDAEGVAGAAAQCVPGGRARARLPPAVRSDAARYGPHPRPARLVAAGVAG